MKKVELQFLRADRPDIDAYRTQPFVPSLIEFGLLVLEKIFFKMFSVFLLVYYCLLLKKGNPLHLNKPKIPSLRMICAKSG
jgi:hypothetical protein